MKKSKNGIDHMETEYLHPNSVVAKHVAEILPTLQPDKKHLAADLMGLEFWSTLSKRSKQEIGAIIFSMVKKGLLPLGYAGKTSSNKHTYWLKK